MLFFFNSVCEIRHSDIGADLEKIFGAHPWRALASLNNFWEAPEKVPKTVEHYAILLILYRCQNNEIVSQTKVF